MPAGLTGKMVRGEIFAVECPSRAVLRRVTNRWSVLVLIALREETLRFSALRRRVGEVSERMLAQTLKQLEADGFVKRVAHPVVPPHVDYSLTPLGRELVPKVAELADWIEENIGRIRGGD
ncbi:helix-turn-helix transcriptional regulator [Methyloligella sp. GL2]|nr:helix-turn-helix transcriptional regulator [Methyloligella sp. GL2]